jgi:hypothetical protein
MPSAQQFVNDSIFGDQAAQQSGAQPEMGAPPYPLYGVPGLGDGEVAVPIYRQPWFCYGAGAVAGFGIAYAFFGWFKPKYMKKNTGRRKKSEG